MSRSRLRKITTKFRWIVPELVKALIYRCRLKKTATNPKKPDNLKILFVVTRVDMWISVQSVFEEFRKIPECEVTILSIPRYIRSKDDPKGFYYSIEGQERSYEFLKRYEGSNVKVIKAYDGENNCPNDLGGPYGYVFVDYPSKELYPEYVSLEKLHSMGSVCYIPYYGYSASPNKYLMGFETNSWFLGHVDHWFAESALSYRKVKRKARLITLLERRKIVHYFGPPRFDLYINVPISKEVKTILWNPRFTTPKDKSNYQSSFLSYKDKIMEFAEQNPDFNIIIRPHPEMFSNFTKNGYMTEEEVTAYLDKAKSLGNVTIDRSPSHFESVIRADLMLADFSSIVVEFALQGKPIISLSNDIAWVKEFRGVMDASYQADNWDEIESLITSLRKGKDPKKETRNAALRKFKKRIPDNIGKAIVDFLVEDWNESKR